MRSTLSGLAVLAVSLILLFTWALVAQPLGAQEANYDESKVPAYELPDPLVSQSGRPIRSAEQWWQIRRPEVLELFETEVYGRAPGRPPQMRFEVFEQQDGVWQGRANRRQVTVYFTDDPEGPQMDVLIYLPADATGPVPLFVGLNFNGNHAITDDPAVRLSSRWMRSNERGGVVDHRATEASRGSSASRWPIEMILQSGYGLASIYCGDIDPDFDDGFKNGVHPLFLKPGQTSPDPDQGGTISAWAWGLSRALDYFESVDSIDHQRVAVVGHSRLGKTALWAGARDQRFALVVSNNSGCGGAALSRRQFGETVARINRVFPHWFCDNFNKYNNQESLCPVDQHLLVALIAPRPVLICSAEEDRWADPKGEFLSGKHADPVYRLLGVVGMDSSEMPPLDQRVGDRIGYYIRPGKHDMTTRDWQAYLEFADRFLK